MLEWRNGENTDSFIWYHRFLSIQKIISEYNDLTSEDWSLWNNNWIPLFEFQGEWYGVECNESQTVASPIVHYFVEDEPVVAYSSLTSYMKTIAKALKEKVIWWEEGSWDSDVNRLIDIYNEFNSGTSFPYRVVD